MTNGQEHSRRCTARHRVDGNASILDFGYLGVVYEVLDYSRVGARLRGPKPPPGAVFEVLLHVSNTFIECRARLLPDDLSCGGCLCVAFESFRDPAFLSPPRRLQIRREAIAASRRCEVAPLPPLREELRAKGTLRRTREDLLTDPERDLVADDEGRF